MKFSKLKLSKRSKQGAMEMTMGTIVTIVLLVSVLIFGLIFTRSIMCKSILITDDITAAVEGQISGLFDISDFGVKCVGEDGKIPKIGTDGTLKLVGCYVKTDEQNTYTFTITKIEILKGTASESQLGFITKEGDEKISKISAEGPVNFVRFAPSANLPPTSVAISIDVADENSGETESHEILLNLEKVGTLSKAIC
jgi:hypothetical protein